jgi:diguanylate cyclase (GGDEF)-like protein
MLEIGAGGELLVAYIRVALIALLLMLPLAGAIFFDAQHETIAGIGGVLLSLIISLYWLKIAKLDKRPYWLSFASSASDVSSVSLVLFLLASFNPSAGTNSVVAWCCYLLCILSTALRNDVRVTFFAGSLAAIQFATVIFYVLVLNSDNLFSAEYGTANLSNSIQRIFILLIFTLCTALIVYRMQRLVQISGADGLTGLPNRMYLNRRVPQLIQEAKKSGLPMSLTLIDLDHFKRINDQLGHQAGDVALCHVVDLLRTQLQAGESLMRIGGEEFLFITPCPLPDAFKRVDFLRGAVAQSHYCPDDSSASHQLTFSAGISSFSSDAHDMSGLLRCADLRLRQAKANGRNQVVAEG